MADAIDYSVVVPVYNSSETLPELYTRVTEVMQTMGKSFEIIFVEDCGPDDAWRIAQKLAHQDHRVKALQLMRNFGQGSATLCGLVHSRGAYVITIDDDLQNPPDEIPKLIDLLQARQDLDVIMGVPEVKNHAALRRFGSHIVNRVNSFLLKKDPDLRFSGFRVMRRTVVDALMTMRTPYPAIGPMLTNVTHRMANIVVRHDPRKEGTSGYTWSRIARQTLSNFIGYSVVPLRLLALIGTIGLLGSVLVGGFFFIRYLSGGVTVPGWTTLVLLLVGLSGFNFLTFAVFGEYLLRIFYLESTNQQFLVRTTVGFNDKSADPYSTTNTD